MAQKASRKVLTMLPDLKVEAVAKAIYNAATWSGYSSPNGLVGLKWDTLREDQKAPFRKLAVAAIGAMSGAESEGEQDDAR